MLLSSGNFESIPRFISTSSVYYALLKNLLKGWEKEYPSYLDKILLNILLARAEKIEILYANLFPLVKIDLISRTIIDITSECCMYINAFSWLSRCFDGYAYVHSCKLPPYSGEIIDMLHTLFSTAAIFPLTLVARTHIKQ